MRKFIMLCPSNITCPSNIKGHNIYLFILLLVLSLSFASPVSAAPFLVCDPQAGVDEYIVEMNGVELPGVVSAEADGSIRYDLSGIVDGEHSVRLMAVNIWGPSGYSDPFVFTKALPGRPVGTNLSR
jgi:hypothetical protein